MLPLPFSGQVSGTIPDYTVELGLLNTNLAAINLTLQSSIGQAALVIPGSMAASSANTAGMLSDISDTLNELKKATQGLVAATSELSNSVKSQTLTMKRMETLQSMAVVDQIEFNRFATAESKAALERNGIDPQPTPSILATIKARLAQAAQFSVTTDFTTSVKDISDNALSQVTQYIQSTAIYTWGQSQLTALWAALGLNKITAKVANAEETAAEASRGVRSAAAKSGVWTPSGVTSQGIV